MISASGARQVFVASLDACSYASDSLLRFQAFASVAFGARGIFWRGARQCAGLGTPKFGLLASINSRLAGWSGVFVPSYAGGSGGQVSGYNITRLWSDPKRGWRLPEAAGALTPGSVPGGLVESIDTEDVIVAELGSMGRDATPLIYVLSKQVSMDVGGAPVRTIRVTLRGTAPGATEANPGPPGVGATQPLEGDCKAGSCTCGAGQLGREVVIRLPGGSGQLIALNFQNYTEVHPTASSDSANFRVAY